RHHVHIEIAERLRVLAERVGDGVARLDVEHHLAGDVFERRVLALHRQDVERLHERQAGVDHRRELAREDDDVAHLDRAHPLLLLRRPFVDLDDVELELAKLLDDFVAVRRIDRRRLELTVDRAGGVRECWHGTGLLEVAVDNRIGTGNDTGIAAGNGAHRVDDCPHPKISRARAVFRRSLRHRDASRWFAALRHTRPVSWITNDANRVDLARFARDPPDEYRPLFRLSLPRAPRLDSRAHAALTQRSRAG